MYSLKRFSQAGGLVLLTLLLSSSSVFAQMPKPFLKYAERHNKVRSGYVKLHRVDLDIYEDTMTYNIEAFFISTPKELKYLVYSQIPYYSNTYCKSAHTLIAIYNWKDTGDTIRYMTKTKNPKDQGEFLYPNAHNIPTGGWKSHKFQRIPPKMGKKNIRYKIIYPDQDILSNIMAEKEFDSKTFNLIQEEFSVIYAETFPMSNKTDILEQQLYDYIHPDILDTISFKFDEMREAYDREIVESQAKQDSLFRDSISRSLTESAGKWIENLPQEIQKDTLFFMPEWKFPTLSGDTLYSDSINTRLLLIDMWYIACPPCMNVMHDLSSIDTVYDESLFKIVSLNVYDKDTAKIGRVVRNLNLHYDIACNFHNNNISEMSKKMGGCDGYPQLYLVDMKTKKVIWYSCGWYQGFTKDIEDIIKTYDKE